MVELYSISYYNHYNQIVVNYKEACYLFCLFQEEFICNIAKSIFLLSIKSLLPGNKFYRCCNRVMNIKMFRQNCNIRFVPNEYVCIRNGDVINQMMCLLKFFVPSIEVFMHFSQLIYYALISGWLVPAFFYFAILIHGRHEKINLILWNNKLRNPSIYRNLYFLYYWNFKLLSSTVYLLPITFLSSFKLKRYSKYT